MQGEMSALSSGKGSIWHDKVGWIHCKLAHVRPPAMSRAGMCFISCVVSSTKHAMCLGRCGRTSPAFRTRWRSIQSSTGIIWSTTCAIYASKSCVSKLQMQPPAQNRRHLAMDSQHTAKNLPLPLLCNPLLPQRCVMLVLKWLCTFN